MAERILVPKQADRLNSFLFNDYFNNNKIDWLNRRLSEMKDAHHEAWKVMLDARWNQFINEVGL